MELFFKEKTYTKDAVFSDDRKHRFVLMRIWDDDLPMIMVVGLNPSEANETDNDPTMTRVIRFARDWGFGGVYMLNLFSQVTAYPKELDPNKVQPSNDFYLGLYARRSEEILCAWGANKIVGKRPRVVGNICYELSKKTTALQINKNGSPKHPLYVKADVERIYYEP